MKFYLISDTHFNHDNIETYCHRPEGFTEQIIRNLRQILKPQDTLIHLGDVFLNKPAGWEILRQQLPECRKILIRGNHDTHHSCAWWMEHGFDFACDSMIFRGAWLTHKPSQFLPGGCVLNIHGHLHNIWHGFHPHDGKEESIPKHLDNPWQRLFAIEYTNYAPVEFEKFISHPQKYQSMGPANLQIFNYNG